MFINHNRGFRRLGQYLNNAVIAITLFLCLGDRGDRGADGEKGDQGLKGFNSLNKYNLIIHFK